VRPVIKGPPPGGYIDSVPQLLTFRGPAAADALQVYRTVSPPLVQCLADWARELDQRAGGVAARMASAAQAKIEEIYPRAAEYLLAQVGAFCSFCESPLSTQLAVEHVVPKSQYPTFAVDWNKFLIACTTCNSVKGSAPARASVRAQLIAAGNANPAEADLYYELRNNRYAWPDISPTTYRNAPVVLHADTGAGLAALNMADATHSNNRLVRIDYNQQKVYADVCVGGQLQQNRQVAALLVPNGQTDQAVVDLCKLNRIQNMRITDRRVMNRTAAWFSILTLLAALVDPYPQLNTVPGQNWTALVDAARTVGFYSVWVTILANRNPQLANTFVAATNNGGSHPGTNVTSIP
jgi:hypothetical protein